MRRKPQSTCVVPDNLTMVYKSIPCDCTARDWECDQGFKRVNGTCLPLDESHFEQPAPTNCTDHYEVSGGYVLAKDTLCSGGLVHHHIKRNCPSRDLMM
jgi:hypothetical protein